LLEVGFDDNGRQRVRIGQECWCSAEHSEGSPSFESCDAPKDAASTAPRTPPVPGSSPPRQPPFGQRTPLETHSDNNGSDDGVGDVLNQTAEDARRRLIAIGEEDRVSRSQQDAFDTWTRDHEDGMRYDEDATHEQPNLEFRSRSSSHRRQAASPSVSRPVQRGHSSNGRPARTGRRSRSLRKPGATKASAGRRQAMADRSHAAQEQVERDR
jgi:hypothetical protein